MDIIKGVSEAFSMQPVYRRIGARLSSSTDKEYRFIDKICVEQIYDTGDPHDYYVGYDNKGIKVFAYRVSACNVEYQ